MIQTVGKIKIRSLEEHLNLLSNSGVSEELIIKETILSVEYLFKVDFRKIIFNYSLESTFIVYCFMRYLIYEKNIVASDILYLFEGKYKTGAEITKLASANKSTHIKIKYSNVKEQLDKMLNELIN